MSLYAFSLDSLAEYPHDILLLYLVPYSFYFTPLATYFELPSCDSTKIIYSEARESASEQSILSRLSHAVGFLHAQLKGSLQHVGFLLESVINYKTVGDRRIMTIDSVTKRHAEALMNGL